MDKIDSDVAHRMKDCSWQGEPQECLTHGAWARICLRIYDSILKDEQEVAVLRGQLERKDELLRDVANSGVAFQDLRIDYVEIQVSRETWNELAAFRGGNVSGGDVNG